MVLNRTLLLMTIALVAVATSAVSADAVSEPDSGNSAWQRWVPDHYHAQFAGNIGMFSLGTGYSFWHHRLQSSLFYGHVPEAVGGLSIHTLALKAALHPLELRAGPRFGLSPLYLGATANVALGDRYVLFIDDRFRDYYWPSALRFTYFLGTELRFALPAAAPARTFEFYAEGGIVDVYLSAWLRESVIKASDVLSLALGFSFSR